jgi:ATP/maltotriose-dependent transcriptional regulator MalT
LKLFFFSAWSLIAASRVREAEQRLATAAMALHTFPCSSGEGVSPVAARLHMDMLAELMTLHATLARSQGDAAQTIAFARQV